MSEQPIDYYDNNCLSRQNRCGPAGGNLVFVKVGGGARHRACLSGREHFTTSSSNVGFKLCHN